MYKIEGIMLGVVKTEKSGYDYSIMPSALEVIFSLDTPWGYTLGILIKLND